MINPGEAIGDTVAICIGLSVCLVALIQAIMAQEVFDALSRSVALSVKLEEQTHELTVALQNAENAQNRAEASSDSKTRFIAAASHDLRQPVHVMNLYGSVLKNAEVNSKTRKIIDDMNIAVESLSSQLNTLLDISEIDSGTVQPVMEVVDLHSLTDSLKQEFQKLAEKKNISLISKVSVGISVWSDPAILSRILRNLCSNAIKYTQSGSVTFQADIDGDQVKICIIDTGIGIAEHEKDRIFEEFHRVDKQLVSDSAMGLGLPIVKRACDMLGYELTLNSTLNEGSIFTVSVPFAQEKAKSKAKPETDIEYPPLLENAIIMVVENDSTVAEGMERVLESWGATPIIVTNQEEAFAQIEELDILPDIFLVDYHLDNRQNGLGFITGMRERFGVIRSILLTADRSPTIVKEANKQGTFVRYKPLDVSELHQLVASLIGPPS